MKNVSIAQAALDNLDPSNYNTPILGAVRKFNADTFGKPWYVDESLSPEEKNMAMVQSFMPIGQVGKVSRVTPRLINNAANMLRGKVTPGDREVIGQFAEMVETGRAYDELGEVGQTVQSLADNLFGKQVVANLDNFQLKEALDLALKKAMTVGR